MGLLCVLQLVASDGFITRSEKSYMVYLFVRDIGTSNEASKARIGVKCHRKKKNVETNKLQCSSTGVIREVCAEIYVCEKECTRPVMNIRYAHSEQ